ncbi:hypothetical protein HOF65_08175 [bacterium]|nr:hypothetical protein [bacterium]MBT4633053.1 hypothetical protein [bacterium]MBT6778368.1 hypothetical protein [bacterium]
MNSSGRVYTGYSFCLSNLLEKLSSFNDSIFHNTPGICLIKASKNTLADNSQLLSTYSPILIL